MPTELVADPMGAVWSKFVFNCVMNPLGALMMGDNAARHNSSEMRALVDDMAAECMAVVRALGAQDARIVRAGVAITRRARPAKARLAGFAAAWQADGIIYVLVVRGGPRQYEQLLEDDGGTIT